VPYLLGDKVGLLSPELFHRLVPRLVQRYVNLCDPPGMATAVRRSLKQAGLPDVQLHEERFDF
jgi:ferredoxin-NADP reductase